MKFVYHDIRMSQSLGVLFLCVANSLGATAEA